MSNALYALEAYGYHQHTTIALAVRRSDGNCATLEYLLDLDGEIFPLNSGHWAKFEVKLTRRDLRRPHGVKYSLTLHDSGNKRVLGFDNSHPFKSKRLGFAVSPSSWDHVHREGNIRPYAFRGAGQLIEDFWTEVYEIVQRRYEEP